MEEVPRGRHRDDHYQGRQVCHTAAARLGLFVNFVIVFFFGLQFFFEPVAQVKCKGSISLIFRYEIL